jgi:hypothetical protein
MNDCSARTIFLLGNKQKTHSQENEEEQRKTKGFSRIENKLNLGELSFYTNRKLAE